MEQKINIRIPEPCHEDWGQMTARDKGRFCSACSKVVVDFTTMQNHEILHYFKETAAGARVCGRFRNEQLAPPLPAPVVQQTVFRRYFSSPLQRIAAVLVTGIALFMSSCKPAVTGKAVSGELSIDTTFSGTSSGDTSRLMGDTVIQAPAPVKQPVKVKPNPVELGEAVMEPVMQGISIMEPDPVESFPMGKIRIDLDSAETNPEK